MFDPDRHAAFGGSWDDRCFRARWDRADERCSSGGNHHHYAIADEGRSTGGDENQYSRADEYHSADQGGSTCGNGNEDGNKAACYINNCCNGDKDGNKHADKGCYRDASSAESG